MSETQTTHELLGEFTGKATEAATLFTEAQQRVLREIVALSTDTAIEGVRLYSELQQTAIEALRDGQAAGVRYQAAWQEAPKDPVRWSQKVLSDGVDGAQKAFRIVEANAQAIGKSAERLQASAERANKGIQETLTGVVTKMKEIYQH